MIPVATRPFCSVRQCLIQPSLPDLHQEVIPKTYRNSVGQLGKEPSGVSDVLRKSIRVRMTSVRIISVYQFTYRVGTVLASQKIPTFGPRRDAIYTMSLPNPLAHSLLVSSTFTYRKRAVAEQQSLARRLVVAQRRVCALFPSPRMTASVCDHGHGRVLHSPSAINWDGHNTKPTKSLLVSVRARETLYRAARSSLARC